MVKPSSAQILLASRSSKLLAVLYPASNIFALTKHALTASVNLCVHGKYSAAQYRTILFSLSSRCKLYKRQQQDQHKDGRKYLLDMI